MITTDKEFQEAYHQDEFGKTYNKWTILSIDSYNAKCRAWMFKVRCECGALGLLPLQRIKNGKSRSCRLCGVRNRELTRKNKNALSCALK